MPDCHLRQERQREEEEIETIRNDITLLTASKINFLPHLPMTSE